jgi:hypothetical protein
MTQPPGAIVSQQTIGELFRDLPNVGSLVENLSDGEFRSCWLINYPHRGALDECCILAVIELSELPYTGRKSNACVMGLVMQLLRDRHGVNAPHNWLPAMKRLRGQSNIGRSRSGGIT